MTQEAIDRFYWRNGACCAGCDYWRSINSVAGECLKSAPVSGEGRADMLGIDKSSLRVSAGHALTPRGHVCGDFVDDFDWPSLPVAYLARIGAMEG